jgi:hypothetical protein
LTYAEIGDLGDIMVSERSRPPLNDVWQEIQVSQVKDFLEEADATMHGIEKNGLLEKWSYERAKERKKAIENGFKVADQNSRWFWAFDPQKQREFFAVTKAVISK